MHMLFICRQRDGNKAYFKRFNEISRKTLTHDNLMIIVGLLGGELFRKMVGRKWQNVEEMIGRLIGSLGKRKKVLRKPGWREELSLR